MALTPEQCKGIRIFGGFDYDQVEKFLAYCGDETFAATKYVFKQDDQNDGKFYVVVSGSVEVVKTTRKGEEVSARLTRGDIFGEMGVFTDHVRAAGIRAAEETACLVLTKAKYAALKDAEPAITVKFVENLLNIYFDRFRAVASKAETASFWL
jgi:CRP-like cAMP-binding protein